MREEIRVKLLKMKGRHSIWGCLNRKKKLTKSFISRTDFASNWVLKLVSLERARRIMRCGIVFFGGNGGAGVSKWKKNGV